MEHDWRGQFKRLEGAYALQTIKSYLTDVAIFVAWREERDLAPFPASVSQVCAFLEHEAQTIRPSSVRRRLYAIRKVHRLLQLPDPTWDEAINLTIRRVRRAQSNRPKQAKGMTRHYLDRCLAAQPDTPWGLRNRAMIALGYDLLARRSELVAIRTDEIDWRSDGTLRVLIRRSKSDPFGMGRIAFTSKGTAQLVGEWLAWRGPDVEALFWGSTRVSPSTGRLAPARSRSSSRRQRLQRASKRKRLQPSAGIHCGSGPRRICSVRATIRPRSCGQGDGSRSTCWGDTFNLPSITSGHDARWSFRA